MNSEHYETFDLIEQKNQLQIELNLFQMIRNSKSNESIKQFCTNISIKNRFQLFFLHHFFVQILHDLNEFVLSSYFSFFFKEF